MSSTRRVPEVRFPGFEDEWEQRKAEDLFESYVDKGHPELPVLSATQEFGMIYRDDTGLEIHHDTSNEAGYKRVLPGQFVIHLRSFQGGFAHSSIEGITSPAYTIFGFKNDDEHVDKFWKYVFSSKAFIKRLETVTYGIRDGRSISYSDFLGLKFRVPSKEEQEKISEFFLQMDETITLHQQKLKDLKKLKNGLLQKMFPQKGEKVPQVRFPGFTGDWEQCQLGDVADVTKLAGFEFTNHVVYSDKGNIIALRGLNVKNGHLVLEDVKYIDKSNLEKLDRSKLILNDVLFTYVGTVGELAIIPENDRYYLAPNVARIRFQNKYNVLFMVQEMGSKAFFKDEIFPLIASSSQPALSMENVRKFTILFPKEYAEQQIIGEQFKQIDDLIILHQRKIDDLNGLKSGLLQTMFVA